MTQKLFWHRYSTLPEPTRGQSETDLCVNTVKQEPVNIHQRVIVGDDTQTGAWEHNFMLIEMTLLYCKCGAKVLQFRESCLVCENIYHLNLISLLLTLNENKALSRSGNAKKHSFFVWNDQRFNRIVTTLVSMLRAVTFFLCKKPRHPSIPLTIFSTLTIVWCSFHHSVTACSDIRVDSWHLEKTKKTTWY